MKNSLQMRRNISQGSAATHLRCGKIFRYPKSVGERMLKIGQHLEKLEVKLDLSEHDV